VSELTDAGTIYLTGVMLGVTGPIARAREAIPAIEAEAAERALSAPNILDLEAPETVARLADELHVRHLGCRFDGLGDLPCARNTKEHASTAAAILSALRARPR
jgi:hypothetical protein